MRFFIGASTSKNFNLVSKLICLYTNKPYSHIYTRYTDPFTEQAIISESSHGEAHKIVLDKWYIKNKIVEEFSIDCSEKTFKTILQFINRRLQASYSEKNLVGVLIYDLGNYLNSTLIKRIANWFSDGESATICSESAAFSLEVLGIQFKRPKDFVRPDHVVEKLVSLSRTEEYIDRVIL